MSKINLHDASRRKFLKWSGCATAAVMVGTHFKLVSAFAAESVNALPDNFTGDIRTHCGLCVNKCGMIARVNNGVIRKLDPIPDHPKSRGMLCAKGNAGIQTVYDPDRLKYPLIRSGELVTAIKKRKPPTCIVRVAELIEQLAHTLERVHQ